MLTNYKMFGKEAALTEQEVSRLDVYWNQVSGSCGDSDKLKTMMVIQDATALDVYNEFNSTINVHALMKMVMMFNPEQSVELKEALPKQTRLDLYLDSQSWIYSAVFPNDIFDVYPDGDNDMLNDANACTRIIIAVNNAQGKGMKSAPIDMDTAVEFISSKVVNNDTAEFVIKTLDTTMSAFQIASIRIDNDRMSPLIKPIFEKVSAQTKLEMFYGMIRPESKEQGYDKAMFITSSGHSVLITEDDWTSLMESADSEEGLGMHQPLMYRHILAMYKDINNFNMQLFMDTSGAVFDVTGMVVDLANQYALLDEKQERWLGDKFPQRIKWYHSNSGDDCLYTEPSLFKWAMGTPDEEKVDAVRKVFSHEMMIEAALNNRDLSIMFPIIMNRKEDREKFVDIMYDKMTDLSYVVAIEPYLFGTKYENDMKYMIALDAEEESIFVFRDRIQVGSGKHAKLITKEELLDKIKDFKDREGDDYVTESDIDRYATKLFIESLSYYWSK